MEVTMAANFLAGTILVIVSLVVLAGGIVVINNIFSKYWKPVKVAVFHSILSDKQESSEPKLKISQKS